MRNDCAGPWFSEEYGGIVAALILATLGFVLYRKLFASDDPSPEEPPRARKLIGFYTLARLDGVGGHCLGNRYVSLIQKFKERNGPFAADGS